MKKLLTVIALHLITYPLYSQQISSRITQFVKEQEVDSFLVFSLNCYTNVITTDSCKQIKPAYLLAVKGRKYFIKKFDYCKSYKPIKLASSNPLAYYFLNKDSIAKEVISAPRFNEFRTNENGIDTIETHLFQSHGCAYKLQSPTTGLNRSVDVLNYET